MVKWDTLQVKREQLVWSAELLFEGITSTVIFGEFLTQVSNGIEVLTVVKDCQ